VFTHTNFFMRLSFGTREQLNESHAGWREFAGALTAAPDKTAHAYQTYLNAPPEPATIAVRFGCFSVDPVGADGVVRFHFGNKEPGDVSPLSAQRMAARRDELRALFAHVRASWPHAREVNGNSWLYHFESYRRLFPPGYGESRSLLRHSALIQARHAGVSSSIFAAALCQRSATISSPISREQTPSICATLFRSQPTARRRRSMISTPSLTCNTLSRETRSPRQCLAQ
jgi:hypothetical protein